MTIFELGASPCPTCQRDRGIISHDNEAVHPLEDRWTLTRPDGYQHGRHRLVPTRYYAGPLASSVELWEHYWISDDGKQAASTHQIIATSSQAAKIRFEELVESGRIEL